MPCIYSLLCICSDIPQKKNTATLPSLGWFTGPCCSGALWNGVTRREDFEFQDQFPLKWCNKSKDPKKWLKISQNIFHCFSCFCAETDFHLGLCAKQKTWWYCTFQNAAGTLEDSWNCREHGEKCFFYWCWLFQMIHRSISFSSKTFPVFSDGPEVFNKDLLLQRVIFNHFVLMHRKHVKKRIALITFDYMFFELQSHLSQTRAKDSNWCFFF